MTKTQVGAVAMVVGCMAGPGTYFAAVQSDRPAMVVKGGSVHVELHPLKGMSKSPDWVDEGGGQGWKPDQAGGKGVTMLIVAVTNPASGTCQNLKGPQVQLLHTDQNKRFTVMIVNGEPSVRPKNLLTANNNLALSRISNSDPDRIVGIQVGGSKCQLNTDSEVWIWQE